ncbi:hypothetical protein SBA7_460010 [Candidatus Sulfotelmatobacter sp. SbA7]|nr:hypothetical protein SBA7_460010 [Candidatus Sulfotelmatobacter sp. SbA7]
MFKASQKFLQWRPAESDVRPYRKLRQQATGISLGRIEIGDQVLMRSKTRNSAFNLTRRNMFP